MGRLSIIVTGCLLSSGLASAYTPTLTNSGGSVRWPGEVKYNLAGNSTNNSGIDAYSFRAAVVRGLQRWRASSGGRIHFDYWQGTDAGIYLPNSDFNGLSSIYFQSNASSGAPMPSNVLGLTQVWYNTASGEILEADIELNDHDFLFTTNSRDTSGYGSAGTNAVLNGRPHVYLENVVTHEIGHAFGLSHSGGLQSTMLYMESPEQAHLSCDESVGIHAIYPAGDAGERGSIRGKVIGPESAPVFGAHVLAISRRRGSVLATGLSRKDGTYEIAALEPGDYFLLVEPFRAGAQALPAYYEAINSNVCKGHEFSRTLMTGADGALPASVAVRAGSATSVPALTVRCGTPGSAAIAANPMANDLFQAPVAYVSTGLPGGFGVAGDFRYTNPAFYPLRNLAGHLEVHALSYTLYSPVHPSLSLLDAYGNRMGSVTQSDRVYEGDSGFVNYDSALTADGLIPGDYTLRVDVRRLNAGLYPAGQIMIDEVPFVLVTGSVNEGLPALSASLPLNARCRMNENFGAYTSPPGDPPRSDENNAMGACGTVGSGGKGPTRPRSIAAWFLPWGLIAAYGLARRFARYRRRYRNLAGARDAS